jgi:hypothetical protein
MVQESNVAVLSKLVVDERTGIQPGKAEIFILIFDKDQQIVAAERGELDLSSHSQKTLYSYLLKVLQPGDYECRVVARDMEMGRSMVGRFSFSVPEPAATAVAFSSPLLLIHGKKAEFLRFSRLKKKGKEPASLIHFYPFLPQNTSPLIRNLESDVKSFWAMLPVTYKGKKMPEMELDVEMIEEAGGDKIPLEWHIIDSKRAEPATDFILIEIGLPNLEPGLYRLESKATDAKSNTQAWISVLLSKR